MTDLVSVIVPVYNAENYLAECIESVLQQTFTAIELILVDDGSSDRSVEIAEAYAAKDARIRFYTQKNQGQSSARNHGIRQSSGNYLLFVDSDDWITPYHVEELYQALKATNSRVAMSCFSKDQQQLSMTFNREFQVVKGTFIELANKLYQSPFPAMSAWCKLYDRNLFKDVRFHEGTIYEDGILFYEIIDQIEQMAVVKSNSYYYRTAENSTLTSKISRKNFDVFKKNAILQKFFEEKHPDQMQHFYHRSLNLNDVIAVKSYQDDRKNALNKELIEALYQQNKIFAKSFILRKWLYSNLFLYRSFLFTISKVYAINQEGNESKIKKIIRKVVK